MGWRLIHVSKHHNIRHENGHKNRHEMMSKLSQTFILQRDFEKNQKFG